jgi:hypothetical protein
MSGPSTADGSIVDPSSVHTYTELEAVELLNGITQELENQHKKEESLEKSIEQQRELAMARAVNGTSYGAALCLNKVKRIQSEKERVNSAIDVLEKHATEVSTQLQDARSMLLRTGSEISLDLSAHSNYSQDISKVLTKQLSSRQLNRTSSHRLVIIEDSKPTFNLDEGGGDDDDDSFA